jgi:hypothetical protein
MAPKKQPKKEPKKTYDYSGLEAGMKCQVESDGAYYAAEIVQVSTSKNRAKAPVKITFTGKGYEAYDGWVGGDKLRSKALKVTVEKPPEKEQKAPKNKPVLYYFPFAGKAELTRLIAAAGGLEIENGVLPEDRKELISSCGGPGTGMPALVNGDVKMVQSAAIQTYVSLIAPKLKFLPPKVRAVDAMWCAHIEDLLTGIGSAGIFGLLMKGDKENFKKDKFKDACETWFGHLDSLAPEEGFVNKGKGPTVADCCAVLLYYATMPYSFFDEKAGFDTGFDSSKYTKLKALADRAAETKGLKEYIESSTTLKAKPF